MDTAPAKINEILEKFTSEGSGADMVCYHCHITGKYQAAAYNECNLKLRTRSGITKFNLRGYDSRLIMQALGKTKRHALAKNLEIGDLNIIQVDLTDSKLLLLKRKASLEKPWRTFERRIRINLVRGIEEDRLGKLVAYLSHKIFDGDLTAIHNTIARLKFNRPIYVGQAVLNLCKHLMYNFWYNQIKLKYNERAQLLYTETGNLLFQVETKDIYKDMKENKDCYNFSKFPKDHPCFDETNIKVVGKFKDKFNVRFI
ncbi:uncharacterized protein LOC124815325 [Hydra vulgaris]|uniref:uncharacterized protein LOC124815325 n=1 Tax=Hydra vulgaris TaxID=6087 RepID=UPI001F5EFBC2|nr:uncharacterized protein LOC124815325 [Hydra vulgaris]